MASQPQQRWNGNHHSGNRRPNKLTNKERLRILRLDLRTIMEQVNLLNTEMEDDKFLCTRGIAMIHGHIQELKHGLESVRVNIKIVKSVMKAV